MSIIQGCSLNFLFFSSDGSEVNFSFHAEGEREREREREGDTEGSGRHYLYPFALWDFTYFNVKKWWGWWVLLLGECEKCLVLVEVNPNLRRWVHLLCIKIYSL